MFTVAQSYSRAETFTNEVDSGRVSPAALHAMMQRKIIETATFGGGALNPFFTTSQDLPLVSLSAADLYTVDMTGVSFYRILGLTVPVADLASLPSLEDGNYVIMESREAFFRASRNFEYKESRVYYLELGNATPTLLIRIPSSLTTALTTVTVTTKRLPDTSFTLDDCRDVNTTKRVDLPAFIIPHFELAVAVDALKQSGMKASESAKMQNLIEDQKSVAKALSTELMNDMAMLKQQNRDQ